jgi:hypothetical protein
LAAAQTTLFRCTNEDGEVEFRQTACPPNIGEKELIIDHKPSGWVPPQPGKPRAEERGLKRKPGKDGSIDEKVDKKQAERCWKKRKQLDDVNWELRRGYKAGRGTKLRRRRDQYEDYLDRFCTEN